MIERKRFRPVTARTRVTSPLPEPVNYLSRRESELSSLSDAIQAAKDSQETDQVVSKGDAVTPEGVTFKEKEPIKIPEPVTYLTRWRCYQTFLCYLWRNKLDRLSPQ